MVDDANPPASSEPRTSSGVDLARSMLSRAKADAAARPTHQRWPGGRRRQRPAATPGSSSGPDDRDPQPLSRAVDRLVAERGWQTEQAVGGVEGRWSQIVGGELAEHCLPERFDDGVLTVRADSTAWATQVRMLAGTVLARLNTDLGAGTVTRLNVVGPTAPSWKKGKLSVKGRGPRDTYG